MSLKHHSTRHTRAEEKDSLVDLVARGDIKKINRLKSKPKHTHTHAHVHIIHIIHSHYSNVYLDPSMMKALDVLSKDSMAHTLWSHAVELNTEQKEAIKKALMHRFQLIQGPPGQCSRKLAL